MGIFDIQKVRTDFPILAKKVNKKPLVYLDNAASTQKPQSVINAIVDYYSNYNSNVHRGVHHLSQLATEAFEGSRETIKTFINARKRNEIIFTSGTTFGINLVANSFTKTLKKGDGIIISTVEHHSNIVPWQMVCEEKSLNLKVIPVTDNGQLDIEVYKQQLTNENIKLVAINHVSNSLGTVNPIKEIIDLAHTKGAKVLVDGAQGIAHLPVDVQDLDVDFYTFSGHKVYAPTGIGVLYAKEHILEEMPPYQGGGEMIKEVTFQKTTYGDLPHKFEAGTPNICGGIALASAIDYFNSLGFENIKSHEETLLEYAHKAFQSISEIVLYGNSFPRIPVISFNIKDIHPYDVGSILDQMGIAVRTGHHCTQPIMDRYKIAGTVRVSFALYNSKKEIDILMEGIKRAIKMLKA